MVECAACRQPVEDRARFCPHCGAAAGAGVPAEDPFVGRTVNSKFRVEALIGQGGMGRVYRARHLTLDRPVVLKMLHQGCSGDPGIVQRFQREARAASRLDHPNSIAVLDFGEAEDGTLFMAMEYVAGRDLARVAADEFPLGEARLVRIGAQILSALAEAHAQGIVHRDLKPENVMIEPRRGEPDFVKVLDFGIAKITAPGAGEPRLTQAGLVCGTPEYMSPEQARGAELDARSDLYSVGVILYQLATGALPFTSDTPVGYLTRHLSETPVPVRRRRPDLGLSAALEAVISRAMEKHPARRFQGADEMRAALLAVRPEGAGPARSRKPFWIFVAAMGVALLGGGSIVLLARRTAAERRAIASISAAQTSTAATLTPPATPAPTPTPASTPAPTPTPAPPPRKPAAPDPARAAVLFRQGEARRASQDVEGAIPLYLAALQADPGLAEAEKKLALCYQLRGDTRRAATWYRRYLASNPPDADKVRAILGTLQ